MKHFFLFTLVLILLLTVVKSVRGQQNVEICKGSGVRCMQIKYGTLTIDLVKGKGAPEVIIKSET